MYVICIDFVMNKLMYFDMFLYNFYKGNVCFKDILNSMCGYICFHKICIRKMYVICIDFVMNKVMYFDMFLYIFIYFICMY